MDFNFADLFDEGDYVNFGDDVDAPLTELPTTFDETPYLERAHNYWMQVPVPDDVVPTGGAPLSGLDDETLLTMSPSLILHMQRTAAQGGLQIVSPRAGSLAGMFSRTAHDRRTTDMFLVGSTASSNTSWPTVDGADLSHLFPDEPIDASPAHGALRTKTKSSGLITSAVKSGDPIATAFLKGRAMVDLQRRADVGGAGAHLAACLAAAWGLSQGDYESTCEATLAPVGELLRYAIRADDAYPTLNAPVEAKKCISVGANTGGRELYGDFAAIDWRRLRVGMEAVYYVAVRVEGYTLVQCALDNPPGDPKAPPNRPGVLQFRPMPGTVWTFAPETFRLDPSNQGTVRTAAHLPQHTQEVVQAYYRSARPLAIAAAHGASTTLVPTMVAQPSVSTGEAIVAGYHKLLKLATPHAARGRNVAATIRDFLYQTLTGTTTTEMLEVLWVSKYLSTTISACGLSGYVDETLVRAWAGRLSHVIWDLRVKLAAEAERRGEDLDLWWHHANSLLPDGLKTKAEGPNAWARAVAYFLLYPYSHKWAGLLTASAIKVHAGLPVLRSKALRLPATLRSRARVFEAANAQARALGAAFGGYYGAMTTVCEILAGQALSRGNPVLAARFNCAALMWDIRAKAATSVRLHLDEQKSDAAGSFVGKTGHYSITTSPYAAYGRWFSFMTSCRLVSRAARGEYLSHATGKVSVVFSGTHAPIFHLGDLGRTRAFRYVADPSTLARDIERTLGDIMADVATTVREFETEDRMADTAWEPSVEVPETPFDVTRYKPPADNYWAVLLTVEPDLAVALEDAVDHLPEDVAQDIQSRPYPSAAELITAIRVAEGELAQEATRNAEALM
jgi:hypothetical protein